VEAYLEGLISRNKEATKKKETASGPQPEVVGNAAPNLGDIAVEAVSQVASAPIQVVGAVASAAAQAAEAVGSIAAGFLRGFRR
jgi:hypothetical protein